MPRVEVPKQIVVNQSRQMKKSDERCQAEGIVFADAFSGYIQNIYITVTKCDELQGTLS